MKLLEFIVKNIKREDIPDSANFFVQDWFDGLLKSSSDKGKPKKYPDDRFWTCDFVDSRYGKFFVSEDASTTIITREELMRAYDLVEQGYTLWFGGECPVYDGVTVDCALKSGAVAKGNYPESWEWNHYGKNIDIIAYKISEARPDELNMITESSPSSPILCDLMRDISNSMPEMMAADMVELADYLISQGWGKYE